MMRVNNIRVVDTASTPGSPIRPRRVDRPSSSDCSSASSSALPLAWTREQLDRSLKTPEDIEQKLNVTFLGLLPELSTSGKRPGYGGGGATAPRRTQGVTRRSGRADRARAAAQRDRRGRAQHPHEPHVHEPGPTLPQAPRDERRAVRGQDDRRVQHRHRVRSGRAAGLHRGLRPAPSAPPPHLRARGRRGGHERPRRRRDARRGRQADEIDNLWSVPAGPTPPNPADMLHSERFRRFIQELGDRFDRVVIDSPPIVAVTDSAIISTVVDGTVFVVRAFKTSKHLSAQGLRVTPRRRRPRGRRRAQRRGPQPAGVLYYYHYYYYKGDKGDGPRRSAARPSDDHPPPTAPN